MILNLGSVSNGVVQMGYTGAYAGGETYPYTAPYGLVDTNSLFSGQVYEDGSEFRIVSGPSNGTLDASGAESGNLWGNDVDDIYTPTTGYTGDDSVTLEVKYVDGTTEQWVATIAVAEAADTTPTAFTLGADVAGAELSVNTDRSFVVAGLDSAQTFTATGDGTVSLTDGSGYVSSVSAKTGDTVYFRLPASGSYATAATGGLGCNGVTDAMSVTTRAQVAPALASTASYTKRIDSAASGTLSLTGGDAAASWSDPSGTDGAQYTITSSGVWTRTSNNPTEEDETFTTTATNAAGTSEAQTVTVSYVEQLIGNMWRPSLSSLKIGL